MFCATESFATKNDIWPHSTYKSSILCPANLICHCHVQNFSAVQEATGCKSSNARCVTHGNAFPRYLITTYSSLNMRAKWLPSRIRRLPPRPPPRPLRWSRPPPGFTAEGPSLAMLTLRSTGSVFTWLHASVATLQSKIDGLRPAKDKTCGNALISILDMILVFASNAPTRSNKAKRTLTESRTSRVSTTSQKLNEPSQKLRTRESATAYHELHESSTTSHELRVNNYASHELWVSSYPRSNYEEWGRVGWV